jgi:tRNA(Ile2) C34 agmatinyltransferase TiaS
MTQHNMPITLLIGIDDTDKLESRGTGFHARTIGSAMGDNGWGECNVITRHQLLVSPLVPFTSHNSAACIAVNTSLEHTHRIINFCRDYLSTESAEGSDPGLCVASTKQLTADTIKFGFLAKQQVITQSEALHLAQKTGIYLRGLGGDSQGIIGALAAVSLNGSGSDGRLLWLEGMRERAQQTVTVSELITKSGINVIQSREGAVINDPNQLIKMGNWPRAIWIGGKATLIIEKSQEHSHVWQVASKDYLKQF